MSIKHLKPRSKEEIKLYEDSLHAISFKELFMHAINDEDYLNELNRRLGFNVCIEEISFNTDNIDVTTRDNIYPEYIKGVMSAHMVLTFNIEYT